MQLRRPTADQKWPQIDSIGPMRGILSPQRPGAAEGKITADRGVKEERYALGGAQTWVGVQCIPPDRCRSDRGLFDAPPLGGLLVCEV